MTEEKNRDEQKFHAEEFEEPTVKPFDAEPDGPESEEDDTDSEAMTILEKFMDYELQTKIGLVSTLIFLLGLIFRWYWLNANWWLVLIFGALGVKTLYSQMKDLEEEKPEEAKIAKYSFVTLITLLIIRDLWITSYFSDLIRFLPVR